MQDPTQQPPRMLVIEDEPAVQNLVVRVLEAQGFSVEAASTGWQGLLRLRTAAWTYDVVVLDLGLPDCPGTRVLDTLHARWPETAVLVLTGARQRPAGADAFLAKPFEVGDLASAVRGLVQARCATVA